MALSIDRVTSAGAGSSSSAGTGALAGDVGKLEIVFIQCSGTLTITPPTGRGWNTAYNNNPSRRCAVFYRVCPDTATDTFTLSSTSQIVIDALYISGFDATTPIPVSTGTGNSANVSSLAVPSLTPTKGNSLRIDFYTDVRTASPFPVPSPPAGQTTQATNTPTASANYGLAVASESLSGTSATGTRTATVSTASPMDGVAIIVSPATVDYTSSPADTVGITGLATTTMVSQPIANLTDDFATQNATKWTYNSPAVASGGQLRLPFNASYSSVVSSNSRYDLTGSTMLAQLVDRGSVGTGTTETFFEATLDSSNKLSIFVSGSNLLWSRVVAGTRTDTTIGAYSATTHKWLRIRESSGTIFWEYAADGLTWTTAGSLATPFAITSLGLDFSAGYYGTETSVPNPAIWDNFNLPPTLTPTPADTVGITGSATINHGLTLADTVGLTDAVTVNHGVSAADSVGLTDIVNASGHVGINFADPETVTDVASVRQTNIRTLADNVGITGTTTTVLSAGVFPANNVGITDSVIATQGTTRNVADTIGITDAEAVFGQLTQVITTTAQPDIEARGVPLTDVANLSGTAGLALDASPAPDLVVGPQRAVFEIDAGSTELTHVIALSGTAGLELATRPRLRVVHRMTDILSEQVVGVVQPMTLTNGPAVASSRADDFSSLDPTKWFIGGTAAVSSGQLVLPCLLDYSAEISSLQSFSLLGSSCTVQLVQAAAPGAGSTNTSTDSIFFINANTADINHNVVGVYAENGTLFARHALSGGFTDVSLGAFTNGVWLRLRETGGTVYWETSLDTVTWTTRMTLPTTSVFDLSTAYVTLMSGFWQVGVVNPTPAIWDNLNVLPRFGGPTGAVGPSDRPAWRMTAGDPYGSAVRTSAPAAWWRLRGNSNDELGGAAGQPIKVTDGTPATPYYGPAIVGSGQSLQVIWSDTVVLHVPDEPATRLAVPMTMEGWLVYSSTLGETWGGAFGNPDFLVEHHGHNFAAFTRTDTDEFGSTSFVNGTAYHVAAVWSGTDVRLYVNGALETNGWPFAISTYPAAPRTTGFQIGYWTIDSNSGNSQPFIGSIQDVAVYPRALSAAEVHAHYQAGLVSPSGDLAANIFDDIPVATTVTASVWMRASAPTTVVLDVADAAGARLIGGPWSKVLADTGWHQWTQTFTTAADWVKNVHALRAPLPAGVSWIEWSDPTVTVTTPRSLSVVPKTEPEQPAPRRLSRVFTVLR